jgi:hypothetical protein
LDGRTDMYDNCNRIYLGKEGQVTEYGKKLQNVALHKYFCFPPKVGRMIRGVR